MRASLSSSLNMNASLVWRPVYRALLTDGNWLERVAGAPRRLPLACGRQRGPAFAAGVSMAKSLRSRRNARTVCARLIAVVGFASALAGSTVPARAADDDPYARPEAWLCRP